MVRQMHVRRPGVEQPRGVTVTGLFAFLGAVTLLIATAFAAPASASSLTDTTYADFSAGTTGAGTYVAESSDGEVTLAPTAGSEFPGSALPSGWFKTPWAVGGDATVSGGQLTVDGARTGTSATYGPGHNLEFRATFSSTAASSHIGFGTDYNAPPWAMFSVKGDGQLYARTDNGSAGGAIETPLGTGYFGSSHVFRIEWTTAGVDYYVDGSLVASHGISIGATPLRVLASDFSVGGGSLLIDWVRMTPYTSPGTFTSRILDAGGPVAWGSLNWTADQPAGTSVALSVRTGNTPIPDGTWSAFSPIASPGNDVPGFSRYAQYSAVLTSADPGTTPTLKDVTIAFDPPNYGNFIKADHPLAYYRLDEPVGSSQMIDRSGNGHHGTYQNEIALGRDGATACERRPHPPRACELANPPENKAGYFPARDGHGYVNGITAPTTAYTMEAWVKPADGNDMMVMSHGGGGQLFIKDGKLSFRQVQNTISSNGVVEPGKWSHVAATWDGSNTRLYVNGTQVAHSGTANKPPSGTSTFFVGYGEMAPWFHGDLDEVAYYAKALPADAFGDRYKMATVKDNPSAARGNTPLNTEGPSTDPVAPKNGGLYAPGKVPAADFSCSDPDDLPGDPDVVSCTAKVDGTTPIANGDPLPGSTGTHSFVVTAVDTANNTYVHTHTYTVKPFSWIYGHDNPIAYYRLGDGSNQPMVDASGNNRHGQYKNDQDSGPTGISGDGNKARDFFGAGGYGYVNGISAPRYQATLEAWVKPLGNLDPSSSEFDGSSLPAGWSVRDTWTPGGSVDVSAGQLVVDGASAGTNATYGSGRTLDFKATFAPGTPFAHAGFGVDYNNPPWAIFSVKGDGQLYARTDNNGGAVETPLGTGYLGSAHRYRIEWTATEVVYYVDGNVVASHNVSFGATQMRPLVSEYNAGVGDLRVDWLRMSPHALGDASIVGHGDAGEIYIKGGYFHFRHMDKTVTSSVPVEPGQWQQVVGTWDGVDIRIYVDGVETGKTEATRRPSSASTFYVGYGELAPWFRGAIDEVAYYGTALPPARVYQHFLADPPPSDQGDPGRSGDSIMGGGTAGGSGSTGGGSGSTGSGATGEKPPTSEDSTPGPETASRPASAQCVQATVGLKKARKAHRRANRKLAKARRNEKKGLRKKAKLTGRKVARQRNLVRSSC